MSENIPQFRELGLSEPILQSLQELGYETPSPIQAESIPLLLDGCDLLGQAQTGTGKTAAFALPLLNNIDLSSKATQLLVLAPTRELAIQVSEAFQSYARHLKGFHVLPIYGGQSMGQQLRQLQRGAQIVVGTPGRVMDHIRRGTLNLDTLKALVLDEADEMLKMGFIDDIEWILEHTPEERQIALFSATMPEVIRKVAHRHLKNPREVRIKAKTTTVDTIEQSYWLVSGLNKLDALTRILETEESDGLIIFVRTKTSSVELAEKLEARGYASAPLHGDMTQALRERTVEKLREGSLDIVVATDVAARGLDVERISHVVNYDIPYDTEAYVHRIGRTGRAGRKGKAILFVANRERRMLRSIERATRQTIQQLTLPTRELVAERRVSKMLQQVQEALDSEQLDFFKGVVTDMRHQTEVDTVDLAAALLFLAQKDRPLQLKEEPVRTREPRQRDDRDGGRERRDRGERRSREFANVNMQRYRLDVGREHGVMPGNIVGAIANEAEIDNRYIGHIKLFDNYSTVDLPEGIPGEVLQHLQKVRVCGRPLKMEQVPGGGEQPRAPRRGGGQGGNRRREGGREGGRERRQ
ncbi:DEAD/DEAH box helicase [Kistimonas asteriae]|uniref:DEAD/DEAH box helicase n=1 Tax=Kistimonas asteriae TaxID=517724 RepID=UPI001BA46375|nr:DEAD/DEAH box helicase [Kistimonas asteriae]